MKLINYNSLNWLRTHGSVIATYKEYYLEVKWLDKKDYSCTIWKNIDKPDRQCLFNQNDDICSYAQGQTLSIQQLNKLIS